jgi:hypothetical protein
MQRSFVSAGVPTFKLVRMCEANVLRVKNSVLDFSA